jgi:hypothetical protein
MKKYNSNNRSSRVKNTSAHLRYIDNRTKGGIVDLFLRPQILQGVA